MYYLRIWIFVLLSAVELHSTHAENENGMTVLNYTNDMRRQHGCLPLTWDDQLSKGCKDYVMTQYGKNNGTNIDRKTDSSNQDSTNKSYTQNTCTFGLHTNSLKFCVMKWYIGARYDILEKEAEEFTAMIWRSSKFMGYADTMVTHTQAVMVVWFSPPGNVPGQYTTNVPDLFPNAHNGRKKKKERWERNSAVHQANRNSLNLLTVLIFMLLFSYFPN